MKIIEYLLIKTNYSKDFYNAIIRELNNGWELWGNPFYDGSCYCQAMVKYETKNNFSGCGKE